MKIIPLAAESLGVRSSAVFVETSDLKILIDPGVSLAPLRFGLSPHPLEIRRMNDLWLRIKQYAKIADVLIVTHYHFDHFDSTEPLVYLDKTVLIKDPAGTINASQRQRASVFKKALRTLPRMIDIADGKVFSFGDTEIIFSEPVPHGPDVRLGWVVQVGIKETDDCFVYTSDVEGACRDEQIHFLIDRNPGIILMDGPLTYMLGQRFTTNNLEDSKRNIIEVLSKTRAGTLILDHHLIRDPHWKEEIGDLLTKAETLNRRVVTAAEFIGVKEEPLEAKRRELFEQFPDMPEEPIMRNERFQLWLELKK